MADNLQTAELLEDLGLPHGNDEMDVEGHSGSGQQRLILAPGLSDDEGLDNDEGLEDLFGPSPAISEIRSLFKGKKIPRRLSDPDKNGGDTPEPSPTKKPRISLFGGPIDESDGDDQVRSFGDSQEACFISLTRFCPDAAADAGFRPWHAVFQSYP